MHSLSRSVGAQAHTTFVLCGTVMLDSTSISQGMGATHMIATVAGYETAYRLLLTGDMVTGEARVSQEAVSTRNRCGRPCILCMILGRLF